MSQFLLLQQQWPSLFSLAREAEMHVYTSPRNSCVCARICLESLVKLVYEHKTSLYRSVSPRASQQVLSDWIHNMAFRRLVGDALFGRAKNILNLGNRAAHNEQMVYHQEALEAVESLLAFARWFVAICHTSEHRESVTQHRVVATTDVEEIPRTQGTLRGKAPLTQLLPLEQTRVTTPVPVLSMPILPEQVFVESMDRSTEHLERLSDRFASFEDGTVLDIETGLMWAAADSLDLIPHIGATWYEANKYCDVCRVGGHRDWRLPTLDELKTLYAALVGKTVAVLARTLWDVRTNANPAISVGGRARKSPISIYGALWARDTKSRGSLAAALDFDGGHIVWLSPNNKSGYEGALPVRKSRLL